MKRRGLAPAALLTLLLAGCHAPPEPSVASPRSSSSDAPKAEGGSAATREAQTSPRRSGAQTYERGAARSPMQVGPCMRSGPMASACAMTSEGAQVREEDIEGGAAFVFTASSPERVDAVRAQVQKMARTPGWSGEGRGAAMPASTAIAVDLEDGARLELRARDAADVPALRQRAQADVERIRAEGARMTRASTEPAPT